MANCSFWSIICFGLCFYIAEILQISLERPLYGVIIIILLRSFMGPTLNEHFEGQIDSYPLSVYLSQLWYKDQLFVIGGFTLKQTETNLYFLEPQRSVWILDLTTRVLL